MEVIISVMILGIIAVPLSNAIKVNSNVTKTTNEASEMMVIADKETSIILLEKNWNSWPGDLVEKNMPAKVVDNYTVNATYIVAENIIKIRVYKTAEPAIDFLIYKPLPNESY